MTFEEWFKDKYKATYNNPNMKELNDYCREFTSEIWNAAIASSLNAVDAVVKRNIDENDVMVYIHEDIKALLTK